MGTTNGILDMAKGEWGGEREAIVGECTADLVAGGIEGGAVHHDVVGGLVNTIAAGRAVTRFGQSAAVQGVVEARTVEAEAGAEHGEALAVDGEVSRESRFGLDSTQRGATGAVGLPLVEGPLHG